MVEKLDFSEQKFFDLNKNFWYIKVVKKNWTFYFIMHIAYCMMAIHIFVYLCLWTYSQSNDHEIVNSRKIFNDSNMVKFIFRVQTITPARHAGQRISWALWTFTLWTLWKA